jgi:hypothetical protein
VTVTHRWEPAGESASAATEIDEDPFALRLPALLLGNKAERLPDPAADVP